METWSDPSGGEIDTACIITTAANRLMARIHDRMPAILEPEAFSAWLDNDGVDARTATALLRPAPEAALELVADRPVRQPGRQRRRRGAGADPAEAIWADLPRARKAR